MSTVNVLVACGSGLCTSSVIEYRLQEIAEQAGVDINITKTTLGLLDVYFDSNDMIVAACDYSGDTGGLPKVVATSIISGIGEEQFEEDFVKLIKEIAEKKNN